MGSRRGSGSVLPGEPVHLTRRASDLSHLTAHDLDLDRILNLEGALGLSAPSRRASTTSSTPGSPRLDNGARITIISTTNPKQLAMELNVDASSPLTGGSSPRSDSSPWIGGTGLGSAGLGKSGRVIERLMAENDRLRREMRAEITKREELQRAVNTQKPKLEGLQTDNARLTNIKSMDDNIIKRRDRKIEELKAELEAERKKREAAETRASEAEQQRDISQDSSRKELQQEREKARHATVHAEILQTSHQQLSREYRQRISTTNRTLRDLNHDRDEDRKRLARLDIVCNQMRQETERMRKVHHDLSSVWQRFEAQKTAEVQRLENNAKKAYSAIESREKDNDQLAEEMEKVLTRMKWVIRMDGLSRGDDSPPPSPPDEGGKTKVENRI
ncbi:hypothetical protein K461DRAFT_272474 [Myriangium duriaei CBS 260.36]|uniref:SWI5-dependent HO expression protein 3 n=1 Tax=Myriangium duriaei CBS 260.36 TaxID=1168546 RepID=A0A9P4IQF4_9PEZI|nr:hypothetical protein K461DRAFT_272474 [Myriangium duriaei CBS 260.36]